MFNVLVLCSSAANVDFETFEYKTAFYLKDKVKTDKVIILTIGSDNVEKFLSKYKIQSIFFPTEWKLYGVNAAKIRNNNILKTVNAAIVYPDETKDTCTLLNLLQSNDIPLRIVNVKKDEEPSTT